MQQNKYSNQHCSLIQLIVIVVLLQSALFFPGSMVYGDAVNNRAILTETEKKWLASHPVIRLAPDPEFKPVEFFDNNGIYAGIGADYAALIADKLGITFKIIRCSNWDEVIARIKNREIDVLNAVVKTPQRERYLLFPQPYLKIPSVIIVRKTVTKEMTLDMLRGMQVVMVSGYGYVDLIHNNYPEIEIELVANLKVALQKVAFGMSDAFVGDLATASFYIELEKITNLKLAGECEPANNSGFAIRSDWPEFTGILEKGIALLTEKERQDIHTKWIHLEPQPGVSKREFRKIALVTLAVIMLIIGGFLLWNRILKRMVRQRTQELVKEIDVRRRAEAALSEREVYLRLLIETIPDLVWLKDPQGVYLSCNLKFERFFGAKQADIVGKTDYDFMEKKLAEVFRERDQVAMAAGKPTLNEEEVIFADDGHLEMLETIKTPMLDSSGRLIGVLGIARDITDRKKAAEEKTVLENHLRQAQKMEAIGTLAGGIAHDFNNILSAIIGFTDLAMEKAPLGSNLKTDLEKVMLSANRATELVRQILTFSRQAKVQRIPMTAQTPVKDGLKMLRSFIPATIEIVGNIDSQSRIILADPTQVYQILMNLCTNAYHAMEDKSGTITVGLTTTFISTEEQKTSLQVPMGEYVVLIVTDTGMGIRPDIIDKIFDPYFTTKETGKGTGMGLAIIHGIMKEYGGAITVESQLGQGSTFRVFFPVHQNESVPQIQKRDDPPGGNERILLIDDEQFLVEVGKEMLESLGYNVTGQSNSLEALETFTKKPEGFDLVITDQTMPYMTGINLSQQILLIRPDIPIILCTGYSSTIDVQTVKSLGVKVFAFKPFTKDTLARLARKALDGTS